MRIATVLGTCLLLSLGGCHSQGQSGALEPDELYNTAGLGGRPLFGPDGLAPPAFSAAPFVRVGFMWDAPEETLLEGRILHPRGWWSGWRAVAPGWSEGLAHAGHLDVGSGSGLGFQLRLTRGPPPSSLVAEAIGEVGEPDPGHPRETGEPGLRRLHQALAPESLVHPRSDWGARAPVCSSGSHSPARVTVHHTATPLPDSVSVVSRLRQIQNYHIDSRGWCDVGYHFLVDWNGEMWQGRNETVIGAHVADNNTSNVGISFLGTYNSVAPTSAQLGNCGSLLAWLASQYGIPLDRSHVKGHREYRGNSAGDCPGDEIQARLDELISGDVPDPTEGVLQGVVFADQGQGTDDMSRRLPGAEVSIEGVGKESCRADDAFWSFDLPAGTYTVTATAPGFQAGTRSCMVDAGGESWCSIGLVEACTPDCAGRACGPDPACGENCGSCAAGQECTPDGSCQPVDPPRGRLAGFVVRVTVGGDDWDIGTGRPVAGAEVRADSGETAATDENGAFEMMLLPGEHDLQAAAPGCQDGSATCLVLLAGSEDCFVPVFLEKEEEESPQDDEEVIIRGGCATAGGTDPIVLAGLLVWGALRVRRRTRPGGPG